MKINAKQKKQNIISEKLKRCGEEEVEQVLGDMKSVEDLRRVVVDLAKAIKELQQQI